MKTSKIVLFLSHMSSEERNQFRFFSERYIKKKEHLVILDYMLLCIERKADISEVIIGGMIGKNLADVRKLTTKLNNQLIEVVERFLATEQLNEKEHDILKYILLMKRLRSTKAEHLFKQTVKKGGRLIKKSPKDLNRNQPDGLLFFRLKHWFLEEVFFHPLSKDNGIVEEDLVDIDAYFCMEILRFACKALTSNRKIMNSLNTPLLRAAIEMSKEPQLERFNLLKIHRLYIELYYKFDEEKYTDFKNSAIKELKELSRKEQTVIFSLLMNQVSHAIRCNSKYLKDALRIYRIGVGENYLIDDGFFIKEHFMNYITTACALNKPKAATLFLNEQYKKLHPTIRDEVKTIGEARIALAIKNYSHAFTLLYAAQFKDIHLRFIARSIRLMACYDWEMSNTSMLLEDSEISIHKELESFRQHLNRLLVKLGDKNERIMANFKFHYMTKKILNKQNTLSPKKHREALKEELDSIDLIVCRNWLGEKIEELGKG